ncbi:polyamine-modulated factor 1-binding protein 1-like isoform X1 [Crassostrea angulata]|uniref:polyamine-modulated factor 1-binding protein 1-like isoform X1 n=1 Tax=Magallana angulata TaxID=2784310 RepID=UPI0022B14CE5|nr:polyamine-modulated factor 1-binding protein 1-like isoform X1 [Crassostrea angulata]
MSTNLDDLFNQIIHSELHAQQKKKYLHDLKCRIQSTLARGDGLQKKYNELKKELTFKTNLLIQEEVNLNTEENKEKILQEKVSALEKEKDDISKYVTDMQNQGEKDRELFCQVVRTFIQNYGLQSDGHDRRKEEQKQALMEARLTEDDLKTELERITEKKRAVQELRAQLDREKQTSQRLQKTVKELDQQLRQLKEQTGSLSARKSELNAIPHRDPEFLSLNKELEILNEVSMENKCTALQHELQRLQQIWWQKEIRERKRAVTSSQPKASANLKLPMNEEEAGVNKMTVSNFQRE